MALSEDLDSCVYSSYRRDCTWNNLFDALYEFYFGLTSLPMLNVSDSEMEIESLSCCLSVT